MPVVAIIQARMGSTRLPGKVLADLAGMPVLGWVVRAARAIPGVDRVAVATSTAAADDSIAEWAAANGVAVHRGPEEDVLARYVAAARAEKADIVLRITADCPLLDPIEAAKVITPIVGGKADFVSNNDPPTYPDGLDAEAFTREVLEQAAALARRPSEREHVTPFMRDPANGFRIAHIHGPGPEFAEYRWTVDRPEDLAFLRAFVGGLADDRPPRMAEVLSILDQSPQLRRINSGIARNEGYARSLARDRAEGF